MTQQAKNHGTAFSDGVRIGSGIYSGYNGGLQGAALSPVLAYEVDVDSPTILYEAVVNAGQLSLLGTPVSYNGIDGLIDLGVCRSIFFDTAGGNLPNSLVVTISALDFWGHKVVEQVTIPAGVTADPILTNKTYRYIKSIYASAGSGSFQVLIKTSCCFGFPVFVGEQIDVTVSWDDRLYYAIDVSGTGIQPLAPSAVALNPYQEDTSSLVVGDSRAATATTRDPRGCYHVNPQDQPSGDEEIPLVLTIYAAGFDPLYGTSFAPDALAPSQANCYGVTQYSTGWQ